MRFLGLAKFCWWEGVKDICFSSPVKLTTFFCLVVSLYPRGIYHILSLSATSLHKWSCLPHTHSFSALSFIYIHLSLVSYIDFSCSLASKWVSHNLVKPEMCVKIFVSFKMMKVKPSLERQKSISISFIAEKFRKAHTSSHIHTLAHSHRNVGDCLRKRLKEANIRIGSSNICSPRANKLWANMSCISFSFFLTKCVGGGRKL